MIVLLCHLIPRDSGFGTAFRPPWVPSVLNLRSRALGHPRIHWAKVSKYDKNPLISLSKTNLRAVVDPAPGVRHPRWTRGRTMMGA